ncbi:flavin reductase family protein [Pseudomonas turukhanskensis]|uniref:Oxidoreductase n=1 Tax=Pseudomonas turukhanskensis TaxID=1806536 RepID=A0A9W6NIS1_9PSED|nr:iron-sulfur cluster-binding domain-containing protein [Pseudomonas turukhanskensis]GLK92245.1 oxidoreductase [Pseudomonas turukhanskensis]
MTLIPFALVRRTARLLAPLRYLVSHGWLRESSVDAVLALLHPAWRLNRVFACVRARRWVAQDMLALTLMPNGNWRGAEPGQHIQAYVEVAGVRLSRSYSLTALNADGSVEIAIKRHFGGRLSNRLLDYLAVGEVLEIGEAFGELHWPADADSVLLLAAGSGLTPLLGLLRSALQKGFSAPVELLHYVRDSGQHAFAQELQALQQQYRNLTVRSMLSSQLGRFSPGHVQDVARSHALTCGPFGFVSAVRDWWESVAKTPLQFESFSPPSSTHAVSHSPLLLRFARAQQEVLGNSASSLLLQAEAAGLRPAHGCRQGICASCTCLLVSGAVRDQRSGAVLSEPGQPIRLCVSVPMGDVVVDI